MANKIINGKKYETEKAVMKAWNDNNGNPKDIYYHMQKLYQKRNGEFFLWETGDIITPLTKNEAKKWAEKNLTGTEYEEVFDPVEE